MDEIMDEIEAEIQAIEMAIAKARLELAQEQMRHQEALDSEEQRFQAEASRLSLLIVGQEAVVQYLQKKTPKVG